MNKNQKIISGLVLIGVVSAGSFFVLTKDKQVVTDTATVDYTNKKINTSENNATVTNNNVAYKQLVVDPQRCIGCGKCARVDGEHFEMNGRLAVVISSKNLSSQNLAAAIRICPVEAITLN